jgi:hypothetical protein
MSHRSSRARFLDSRGKPHARKDLSEFLFRKESVAALHPYKCKCTLHFGPGCSHHQCRKPLQLLFFVDGENLLPIRLCDRDGLITNDKFCFSRWGELHLNWWRRPLRLRNRKPQRCGTLLEGNAHPGGSDEAGMDNSQTNSGAGRWSASLGSSLPVPSEMGADGRAGSPVNPDSTGGTP